MSLSRREVNPLGVLGLRQLKFIPEHFTKIVVDGNTDVRLLSHWINYNLNSRYAVKRSYSLDPTNKMIDIIEIGMEDPKEILILTLGCPHIHLDKKGN
jgi:hypothetical protein